MRKTQKTKNYSGLTLVEMMVAIAIMGIAMAGINLLFIRIWNSNKYTIEMGQSAMAVSQGMNKMVNYLRGTMQSDNGAYPIELAQDNELIVYANYDEDDLTERLHFYKSGNQVLMGVTKPTNTFPKTYPAEDSLITTIASSIVNEDNVPIFYYYDKNYSGEVPGSFMATPATVANVRLIRIFLKINIDPNHAPDNIETQSFVELRNLNDYDRFGVQ